MMPSGIEAILFDLDSTLTDRRASILRYAHAFYTAFESRLDRMSPSDVARVMRNLDGNGYTPRQQVFDAISRMSGWLSIPDVEEIQEHWRTSFTSCTVGQPDLHETLLALAARGYRLGVVTNGSSDTQRKKIAQLGIEKYLQTIVVSKETDFAKPDEGIFQIALQNLSVTASRCFYIGDHPTNDVCGASQAGLLAVWVEGYYDWPVDLPAPERKVSSLREILELPELSGIQTSQ